MAKKNFKLDNPATAFISQVEPALEESQPKTNPVADLKPVQADAGTTKAKNGRITLILPTDMLEAIDNLKWTARMNRQEVIRQAVKEYLERNREGE